MKLTDILSKDSVRVPLQAANKTEAITELVDVLAEGGKLLERDLVLQAVLDRERTASTGIGHGLAVPHGKSPGCSDLVMAIGKPAEPMDFSSKDGRPVEIVVLLASPPDKTGPHIQALARISRLMLIDSFRSAISEATTSDELWAVIEKHES
jgi:nitrogen PTS system EIIA component